MTQSNFVVDGFFVYCMHFQLSKEKIKKCPGGAVWTCQMTGIDVDWAQEPGWGGVGWGRGEGVVRPQVLKDLECCI